jgi:hypothetical protein
MIITEPWQHCGQSIECEAEEVQVGEAITCSGCNRTTHVKLPGKCALPAKSMSGGVIAIIISAAILVCTVIAITVTKGGNIATSLGIAGVGVIWMFLALIGLVLAICWLIFPWIVYVELRRTQKILEQIRDGRK